MTITSALILDLMLLAIIIVTVIVAANKGFLSTVLNLCGTAIALADAMNEVLKNEYFYTYDRSEVRRKRDKKEIGISSVRGGSIVGEHEVIFAGTDEVVTISHTAYSRAIFGKGALAAAKFLAGKKPGLYGMQDVIG